MNTDIAIITVNLNPAIISDLLDTLATQSDRGFHLYIVDFSPTPVSLPHQLIDHKLATVMRHKNTGYAGGVNVGLMRAKEHGIERFVVINDDTYVEKDFVKRVKMAFDQHPSTLIGGKIYYAPGYEYHQSRYEKSDAGRVLWYAGGAVQKQHATTTHRGVDEVDDGQYDTSESTEFITGCLVLFDQKALDAVGLWDESYFLYYEDADYCERAKRNNIPLIYDPSIVIWHKTSSSTGGSGSSMHVHYQRKNQIKWSLKYMPLRTTAHLLKNLLTSRLKS